MRKLLVFALLRAAVWCAEIPPLSFREACLKGDEAPVMRAALANPALALRQSEFLLPLPFAAGVLRRLAAVAPDEAAILARRDPELRDALAAGSPEMRVLAGLAQDAAHDMPARRRVAALAGAIARSQLTLDAAWKLAPRTSEYLAELAGLHESAAADEAAGIDRALEFESVTLCHAAQAGGRALSANLGELRPTDLYLVLAFGGAECTPVFAEAFDKLLLPKLGRAALIPFLTRTAGWQLREFTAAALDAGRFEKLVPLAGASALANLALQVAGPNQAVEIAEMAASPGNAELKSLLAAAVAAQGSRAHSAQDRRGEILYGLLAARLLRASADAPGLREAAGGYSQLLDSSSELDINALFDSQNRCVQRYFFWDDDDGVESFENFRRGYERDPAWQIEETASYLHLTGHGAEGRAIEIFANIPIDLRKPANREREGEARRRQAVIAAELERRGLTPTVLVHRGHSFHVEKTLSYVTPAARLVVLGSCRGVPEIHHVIEVSPQAQVIATRGTGAMQINDSILRGLNRSLLSGAATLHWSEFWREEIARSGRSAALRDYVTPDRDEAAAVLRGYYLALAAQPH